MKRRLVAAAVAAFALAGCGPDLYDVPLPSEVSGDTFSLKAEFESALNLPVASPVKLNGKTVGEVTKVGTSNYIANVTLAIAEGTELPVGTTAEVRLTAPVGEAFVALVPPEEPTGQLLEAGQSLGLESTRTAPDTTDLLNGVSTTVTGGTYGDLKIIIDELVIAMDGSSGNAKNVLREVDALVTSTNEHRDDIDAALDSLDALSANLAEDSDTIAASLKRLDPAVQTLQQHEDEAVKLLAALERLEGTSRSTLDGLQGRLEGQLNDTRTVVDAVIEKQDSLRPMMQGISAFGAALERATPGDFALFDLRFNVIPAAPHLPSTGEETGEIDDSASPVDIVLGLQDTVDGLVADDGLLAGLGKALGGGGLIP